MVNVEVYSVEGKRLRQYNSIDGYVDLDLASGLYLVKLTNNEATLTRKIIIE